MFSLRLKESVVVFFIFYFFPTVSGISYVCLLVKRQAVFGFSVHGLSIVIHNRIPYAASSLFARQGSFKSVLRGKAPAAYYLLGGYTR